MRLSSRAVKIMVGNLVHDNITVRKVAIHNMAGVLRQHKRKHPTVEREVERGNLVVGDRPDNAWLQYKQEHWPKTKEQWNAPNFVHKTHFGYYCWPEKMMVYAGEEHQPRYWKSKGEKSAKTPVFRLDRTAAELDGEEKEVFVFFSDDKLLDRLLSFLSLEENKGKDRLDLGC